MKKYKVTIALLAFSLGIFFVWSFGVFSYIFTPFRDKMIVSEISTQTNEIQPDSDASKEQSSDLSKLIYPFEKYPVTEIYKGKNAPLKLTRKEKESVFGEKLQYTMENYGEVNFAGHYIVATWSCGMWCDWSAIIDAKTGKVYSLDVITSLCAPDSDIDFACLVMKTSAMSNTKLTAT